MFVNISSSKNRGELDNDRRGVELFTQELDLGQSRDAGFRES